MVRLVPMPEIPSMTHALQEAMRVSALIDSGIEAQVSASKDLAESEQRYRKARSLAWVHCPTGDGWTAARREAWVDGETADHRYERDLAEGMRHSAIEAVRARRAQVSLLQSIANAHKSEAEMMNYGPDRT